MCWWIEFGEPIERNNFDLLDPLLGPIAMILYPHHRNEMYLGALSPTPELAIMGSKMCRGDGNGNHNLKASLRWKKTILAHYFVQPRTPQGAHEEINPPKNNLDFA